MSRCTRSLIMFLFCLLIPQTAWATWWLEGYDGKPKDFHLIRDGKAFAVINGTVLKPGDTINVLSADGKLVLKDDYDNKAKTITKQDGTFTIPPPHPRPGPLGNALALIDEKISIFLNYKTTKSELSSRSKGLPVLILGASSAKNYLLAGTDALTVHWIDGEPPYRVQLLDEEDNVIAEKTDVQDDHATLTGIHLSTGEYILKVSGQVSSYFIHLSAVEAQNAPALYHTIMASDMPDLFKQRYAATILASKPEWKLQALLLAEQADWHAFRDRILDGKTPEPIDEQ